VRILLSILVFFTLSSLAIAAYRSDIVTLSLIEFSDFEEIRPHIYVSAETSKKQRQQLLVLIDAGKKRIENTFGAYTATATIIASSNKRALKPYGNNSYASAKFFPNQAYLIIGENGFNIDVISHELAHAELFARIGYIKRLLQIPLWFDEGVAMQLDFREKYNYPPPQKPELSQLKYAWQFFNGDSETLTAHYALAKDEVKHWLSHLDTYTLANFLDEINQSKDFDTLYVKHAFK